MNIFEQMAEAMQGQTAEIMMAFDNHIGAIRRRERVEKPRLRPPTSTCKWWTCYGKNRQGYLSQTFGAGPRQAWGALYALRGEPCPRGATTVR